MTARLRLAEVEAAHVGGTFEFDVEVLAASEPRALPKTVRATCNTPGCIAKGYADEPVQYPRYLFLKDRDREPYLLSLEKKAKRKACGSTCTYDVRTEELDYTLLTVGDVAEATRYAEWFNDTRLEVHLLGVRPPKGYRIRLTAMVVHPASGTLTLISKGYTELDALPTANAWNPMLLGQVALLAKEQPEKLPLLVSPDMVGRPLVQEGRLLVLASPLNIPDVEGKLIRGSLYEALVGDTRTNKSESAKDTAMVLNAPFVQAENASRTGLTYSIPDKPSGQGKQLVWGLLPRNHGRYVVIDGLEGWNPELQGELRGVMNDQKVRVDRVLHGERPAGLRLTITANPRRPVADYAFRCEAIADCQPFQRGPDMARVDLWYVLGREDVPNQAIAARVAQKRPLSDDEFRAWVWWCWQRKPEDYGYTDEAKTAIKGHAERFMVEYGCASLPIVHGGFRDLLCRVAVAYANLLVSTSDGIHVTVEEEHVERAVAFLDKMYSSLALKEYKTAVDKGQLTNVSVLDIAMNIGQDGMQVFQRVVRASAQQKHTTAKEIATDLGFSSEDAVKRVFKKLTDEGLVETRPGLGVFLTRKGALVYRKILKVHESDESGDSGRKSARTVPPEGTPIPVTETKSQSSGDSPRSQVERKSARSPQKDTIRANPLANAAFAFDEPLLDESDLSYWHPEQPIPPSPMNPRLVDVYRAGFRNPKVPAKALAWRLMEEHDLTLEDHAQAIITSIVERAQEAALVASNQERKDPWEGL